MDYNLERIAQTIKSIRINRNLSQSYMAAKLHVDISTYEMYEYLYNYDIVLLSKICNALNIEMYDLIYRAFVK